MLTAEPEQFRFHHVLVLHAELCKFVSADSSALLCTRPTVM